MRGDSDHVSPGEMADRRETFAREQQEHDEAMRTPEFVGATEITISIHSSIFDPIAAEAREAGRTVKAEILHRLRQSLKKD